MASCYAELCVAVQSESDPTRSRLQPITSKARSEREGGVGGGKRKIEDKGTKALSLARRSKFYNCRPIRPSRKGQITLSSRLGRDLRHVYVPRARGEPAVICYEGQSVFKISRSRARGPGFFAGPAASAIARSSPIISRSWLLCRYGVRLTINYDEFYYSSPRRALNLGPQLPTFYPSSAH